MRNITPIMTPSSVKKLFSFCTRICWSASRTASRKGMLSRRLARCRSAYEGRARTVVSPCAVAGGIAALLVPQRLHRIQLRRLRRREHAEQDAREGARAERGDDGERRHAGGDRRGLADERTPRARRATRPITAPMPVSVTASTRNCQRIVPRVAPSALRTPISRVRSVTEIIMIATTPTPPTISPTADSTIITRKNIAEDLVVDVEQLVLRDDREVVLHARAAARGAPRIAAITSSIASSRVTPARGGSPRARCRATSRLERACAPPRSA